MKVLILYIGIILISCSGSKKESMKDHLTLIKALDLDLLMFVRIEARQERDNIYVAPSFVKEVNDEYFLLPSFSYFGCIESKIECLQAATKIKYDLIEFSKATNGVTLEKEAIAFAIDYSNKVMNEYEKSGVVDILSDSKIGNCIIFFPDKEHYIAYVPDLNEVHNEFWKERFIESNKAENSWYLGVYK